MRNPYWHPEIKPHQTDRSEIRRLCFEIVSIVLASIGRQGQGDIDFEDGDGFVISRLDNLCHEISEAEISKRLLWLALIVRTFDETMGQSDEDGAYRAHRDRCEESAEFGTVFEGKEGTTQKVRECCNKIIHALDFRPTYDSDDERESSNCRWGMTGEIELEGIQGGKSWSISLWIIPFLEGVLALIEFGDRKPEAAIPASP